MSLLINDVSFSYGTRPVLRGVTWELEQGVTMLLGSNGAGKSTLLGLVATKFALTAGGITADGRSWSAPSDLEAIRRRIGWVPQALDVDRAMRVRDFVSYCGWKAPHWRHRLSTGHPSSRLVGTTPSVWVTTAAGPVWSPGTAT
ncbi:ATP-binding cassette domain-containing protein [Nocardia sp. NPDC004573]